MAVVQDYNIELEHALDKQLSELGISLSSIGPRPETQPHPILHDMPHVRAVDRNGQKVRLLRYINLVRTGKYWSK